jgi:hypothetical protein
MRKAKKLCPKCGLEGSGPYKRWVLNSRKKRYEPYYYFAHKHNGKIRWCYLGKLPNKFGTENRFRYRHRCVDCANLTEDNFCVWQQAYIKKRELLTQPFKREGFQPKRQELSNNGETDMAERGKAGFHEGPPGKAGLSNGKSGFGQEPAGTAPPEGSF